MFARNSSVNRRKQVDTLKVFNDNVTEVQDNAEYKVEFVSGETPMCLLISLPPEFPNERPFLQIQPAIIHSWVDDHININNAPGLLNWTVHSDLGRVVQVIIRELQVRPPVVLGCNTKPVFKVPSISGPSYVMPPIYLDTFPELNKLSSEELEELKSNPDKLDDMVINMRQCYDLNTAVDNFIVRNEKLAEDNLSRQSTFEALKTQVKTSLEEFHELKHNFEEKNKEYEYLCQKYQPQNIRESLQIATLQTDEESEIIAEQFLNKEIDVEQFLLAYLDKRKLSHLRKAKEEKLNHQLKEFARAGY